MYKNTHFSFIEEHFSDSDKKWLLFTEGWEWMTLTLRPPSMTLSISIFYPAPMRNWSPWIMRDMQEYPLPLECPFQTTQSLKTLVH
jgi:hypothetical protein